MAAVAAIHAVLLFLLARSVVSVATGPEPAIIMFDVAEPPPPPPKPAPPEPGGAAPAEPPAKPRPSPVPPQPEAPVEVPAAAPPAAAAGVAAQPGGGGTGGVGQGMSGSGVGGGGIQRARWLSGAITRKDYPKSVSRAGQGGAVTAHFDIWRDGSVHNCRVVVSSGIAELDATTCRLIEQRFRYTPARNAQGDAIEDIAGWRQDWWLEPPR